METQVVYDTQTLSATLDKRLRGVTDAMNKKWTVLLLRPELIACPYGPDTFTAQVEAPTPALAIEKAQKEAAMVDGFPEGDDPPIWGCAHEAYFCLGCYEGYITNYSDYSEVPNG